MEVAAWLAALVAVSTAVAALAARFGFSEPLALTVVGFAASFLPRVPHVELTPNLVLVGLLPPLLYTAAIRTSLVDFRANKRPILLLSVGLVVFTAFGVAVVVWSLLPVPFPVALALGAVVAPPDAVAATAIANRVGLPRRIVTLLEGESLLNDATAIVTLRTAIAAIAGAISVVHIAGEFVLAVGVGVAIGVLVALLLGVIRRRVHDPVIDTTISFLAPFVAYLPAEHLHGSGVLAVVTAGLILGQNAPRWQTASSRIAERTNWRTVQFVLENTVFMLIGLQARSIVQAAWRANLGHARLIWICAAVLLAVMLLRPIWVFPATYLPRLLIPAVGRADPPPNWRVPAVISWAGMRGVVTLAVVFVLPLDTPYRSVLVLMALVVVGGTLLFQGSTLPMLVRRLRLRGPSYAEDALQVANLLQQVTAASNRALNDVVDEHTAPELVDSLVTRSESRTNAAWERLGPSEDERTTPSESYRRLRMVMLGAERDELLRVRDTGVFDQRVLQIVMSMIDLEESMIDRLDRAEDEIRDELAVVPGSGDCAHMAKAPRTARPDHPGECESCIEAGVQWVHLRMCLTCGHVACCDSSPLRHATAHYRDTGQPVMRSVEPGEAWRWCYVDDLLG